MSGWRRFLLVSAAAVLAAGSLASCSPANKNPEDASVRLEVHYFFNPVSPPSLHLATQWVTETIENGYRSFLDSGKLGFIIHRTDDPLEADVVAQYRAVAPALFLVRFEKDRRKAEEVKTLWAYLDPTLVDAAKKSKFIEVLKEEIDLAFGAQARSSAPITAANEELASLDFRITYASTPLALDIILLPYDASGKLIVVDGKLAFTIWEKPAVFITEKGVQLQQWKDVPITSANYASSIGLTTRLPYQNYQPSPGAQAFLRLEFVVDGKEYAVEKSAMIRPLRC